MLSQTLYKIILEHQKILNDLNESVHNIEKILTEMNHPSLSSVSNKIPVKHTTPIDIYNLARQNLSPIESVKRTIVDLYQKDKSLNFYEMISALNRSANVIHLGINDIFADRTSEKTNYIRQQIDLAASHLANYITWDVVNKFITETTLTTESQWKKKI